MASRLARSWWNGGVYNTTNWWASKRVSFGAMSNRATFGALLCVMGGCFDVPLNLVTITFVEYFSTYRVPQDQICCRETPLGYNFFFAI
eukprot:gene9909-biopygen15356